MPITGIVTYTGTTKDTTMIKDMTDEGLLEFITNTRILLANAAGMKKAKGFGQLLRHLDIAVAVKRQRGLA